MRFIVGLILAIVIGTAVFVSQQNKTQSSIATTSLQASVAPTPIHYTAHFAIFTNGTFRDFSNERYHNQNTDVYLKADNPNEVHLKTNGVTWQTFFDTLPMKLTKDCLTTGTGQEFCTNQTHQLKFFINGKQNQNALNEVITLNSKLLVSFGAKSNSNESELEKLEEISSQ